MIEIQKLKFVKNSLHKFDHIRAACIQQHTAYTVMSTGGE